MASNVQINIGSVNKFLNKTVQPYLRKKAEEIAVEARNTAPIGATSALRDSIIVTTGAKGSVKVSVTAPYAGFVSEGTGPAAISPRAAYYPRLRRRGLILWSDSKNLNPYKVAHGISIHGTPPNPYFENAITSVLGPLGFRWIKKDFENK